jgi:hypothetical protein
MGRGEWGARIMDMDFPAAHSMDTEWFAVDAKGHVGVFFSCENGAIPHVCERNTLVYELLDHLRGRPAEEGAYDSGGDIVEGTRHGLFSYVYLDDWDLGVYMPYEIRERPTTALHVDQLPPRWRKLVKGVQFAKCAFTTDDMIQPADHIECVFWTDTAWFLSGDRRTVRCVGGPTEEFAAYCRQLRQEHPELIQNLIFEGVEDEPPAKPKPKPRRKKKDR